MKIFKTHAEFLLVIYISDLNFYILLLYFAFKYTGGQAKLKF